MGKVVLATCYLLRFLSVASAPFSANNLLAVRIGDGSSTLSITAVGGAVVEISPNSGAVVQTLNLPTAATGTDAPCAFYGSANQEGVGTTSADGRFFCVPCYGMTPGQSSSTSSLLHVIARVDSSGNIDTATQGNLSAATNLRGCGSYDGSRFYVGTNSGLRSMAYGTTATPLQLTPVGAFPVRQVSVVGTSVYTTTAYSPWGVSKPFSTPPTGSASVSLITTQLPGTGLSSLNVQGFAFDEAGALWTSAFLNNGTTGLLQKYALSGGTWIMQPGFPLAAVSFTLPSTGAAVSVQGLRALVFARDPASPSAPALYATTYSTTSGGNYILKFNTATFVWSWVATAPVNMQYAGLDRAPIAPTPSITATPSQGAAPTGTPTATRTSSATPSGTPQACAAAANPPVPFAPTSWLAVRVGSGTSALQSASSRDIWVDEIDRETGARLQSIAIPSDPASAIGCTWNTNAPTETAASVTADGLAALLPCYATGPADQTISSAVAKKVLRLRYSGSIDAIATWTSPSSAVRSVAALVADGLDAVLLASESTGIRSMPFGTVDGVLAGAVATLVPSGSYRYSLLFNGALYVSNTSGILNRLDSLTASGQTPARVTGASGSGQTASFVFQDATTLFMGDSTGGVGISKFTYDAGADAWVSAPGWPRAVAVPDPLLGVTYPSARSLQGYVNASTGHFTLAFVSQFPVSYAAGGGALLTMNTVTGSFTILARGCMFSEYRSIIAAPLAPPSQSATPTPSATASVSATPTATVSGGAAPSATSSQTGTPSNTPSAPATGTATQSGTPTPTATSTPGRPFAPGSLAILRAGDGATPLSGNATVTALLEVDPATGSVLQEIRLPSQTSSGRLACTLGGGSHSEGMITQSADGALLAVPCYTQPDTGASAAAGQTRTIVTVNAYGVVQALTGFTTSAGENLRGVATTTGARFYISTSSGLKTAVGGVASQAAAQLSASANLRHVLIHSDGSLLTSVTTAPFGIARVFSAPLPGGTPQSAAVLTAILPGTAAAGANVNGFVFDDEGSLWTAAYAASGSSGFLQKFTLSSGVWALASGYPKTSIAFTALDGETIVTATGLRTLAGRTDPVTGRFVLYALTSGGANALVRFDQQTNVWTAVLEAPAFTSMMGLAWAPVAPSASPTTGGSPSPTRTPSRTGTASATPSGSPPPTATPSPATRSPTATPALCAPPAAPVPFTPGNLLVLRVGDGVSGSLAGAREFSLDEYSLDGVRVQSIAVPPTALSTAGGAAGCVVNTGTYSESYIARTGDGFRVLVPCYGSGPSGAVVTAAVPKVLLAVDHTGAVSVAASWLSSGSSSLRSVAAPLGTPGSVAYVSESNTVKAVTMDGSTINGSLTLNLIADGFYRGSALVDGALYVTNTSGRAVVWSPDQLAAGVPSTPAPLLRATTGGSMASIVFESPDVMWTGEFTGTVGIGRFTRESPGVETWALSAGFPLRSNASFGGVVDSFWNGVRGMTGIVHPATGHFTLYFASSGPNVPNGGNLLASYNTVTGQFATLACACANTEFRAIARVPVAPSSSATPSASQSAGASPAPTSSSSGSATGTPSGTPPPTPSRSASPSPSAECMPANAGGPSPFGAYSVLALRVGNARSALQTSASFARELFIDEVDPASGERLQTLSLGPACTLSSNYAYEGQFSRTEDAGAIAMSCWAVPVGTVIIAANHSKSSWTVGPSGVPVLAVTWSSSATSVRATASRDGSVFWVSSNGAVVAVRAAAAGNASAAVVQPVAVSNSAGHRGLTIYGGALYGAYTGTASVQLIGGAAAATAGAIPSTPTYDAALSLPGVFTNGSQPESLVFESATIMWVLDFGASGPGTLARFTRASASPTATWARDVWLWNGVNVTVPGTGGVVREAGRAMTGWTDPSNGRFHLIIAGASGLYRYDTVTGAPTLLLAGCPNTQYRGVALAPQVISPTATPTGTASTSPTRTGTPTASASAASTGTGTSTPSGSQSGTTSRTASRSGTPSSSGSRTGTPPPTTSRTGTPSASVTSTGSVSATPSETASVSASASPTASVSATQTGTASASGTETGTPSGAQTGTATGSPSSSGTQTGTPSASGTASGTGTSASTATCTPASSLSATKTRIALPSATATRTRTRTRTASRTKTKTKTKTGTPSKKKKLRA